VNGPVEKTVPVQVAAPQLMPGPIDGAGGSIQASDGSVVAIAPGSLATPTTVSLTPLSESELPLPLADPFQFAAGFHLELGDQGLRSPARIMVPVGSDLPPGSQVSVYRAGSIPDATGADRPAWLLVDAGVVGADGFARMGALPLPGVLGSG